MYLGFTTFNYFIYSLSESQIFRMLVTCTDQHIDERKTLIDRKLALISQGHITESQLAEHVQFVLQYISLEDRGRHGQLFEKTNFDSIFKSYSGSDLELEESIGMYTDSLMKLSCLFCSLF